MIILYKGPLRTKLFKDITFPRNADRGGQRGIKDSKTTKKVRW